MANVTASFALLIILLLTVLAMNTTRLRFGTARSTVAPFGTRPELGTLRAMRDPSLPETPKPLTTRLPCPIA